MTQVTINIGSSDSNHYVYTLSDEKVNYLLKFINSITDDSEQKTDLMKEIEIGLKQVKKMRNGEMPKKTLKQMLNGK
ncbi:MAG: hypothetical protein A2033_04755 [Bacteroidetes bacterium GWA2_31_9]|nr:MAG: hypothetical protein A2033_04755 [Bacteroidetes bacterium GWA2_31_9]